MKVCTDEKNHFLLERTQATGLCRIISESSSSYQVLIAVVVDEENSWQRQHDTWVLVWIGKSIYQLKDFHDLPFV